QEVDELTYRTPVRPCRLKDWSAAKSRIGATRGPIGPLVDCRAQHRPPTSTSRPRERARKRAAEPWQECGEPRNALALGAVEGVDRMQRHLASPTFLRRADPTCIQHWLPVYEALVGSWWQS